ncbi:MAG: membrane protein insertase YidC [Verrucomicrobiota bacterium]|nr:membrane protein insertase YidC [Verrucomicrobiota bacterium]
MDRQAWIAVTICALGLIGWQIYMTSHAPRLPARAMTSAATPAVSATATPPAADLAPSPASGPAASAAPAFAEKTESLKNSDVELRLTNRGGGVSEAILLNHVAEKDQRVILNSPERMPIGAIVDNPASADLAEFSVAPPADGAVILERTTPDRVNVRKKFFLPATQQKKDNFVVEMDVDFRNDNAQPYSRPDYFVALGSAAPIHPKDMPNYTRLAWAVAGKTKGIDVSWFAAQNYPFVGVQKRAAQEFYTEKFAGADWAGTTNQFFATLVTPLSAKATEIWGHRFEIKRPDAAPLLGIEGALGMPGFQLQPGQTVTQKFQIYAGPKLYGQLAKLEHGEAEIMNFGMWKLVSQFLLNLMNWLYSFVGNYAIAILLLTAIIKGVLWPLQNKANKSMRRMSALAPKMQELKEKYKDDPTKMNAEVMKLYKAHGVNPVGGCLPMAIQIPIFFGLLSMLGQAVELRNAKFLWVHDLSQPDTVGYILGFPINILPLIMGATNVWLMRMTPKTGDTTQQKVMMFMPLIFLFFCYNFAAALALYYATQNLFTILQLYQNRKQPVPVLEKAAPVTKRSRKGRP